MGKEKGASRALTVGPVQNVGFTATVQTTAQRREKASMVHAGAAGYTDTVINIAQPRKAKGKEEKGKEIRGKEKEKDTTPTGKEGKDP